MIGAWMPDRGVVKWARERHRIRERRALAKLMEGLPPPDRAKRPPTYTSPTLIATNRGNRFNDETLGRPMERGWLRAAIEDRKASDAERP